LFLRSNGLPKKQAEIYAEKPGFFNIDDDRPPLPVHDSESRVQRLW